MDRSIGWPQFFGYYGDGMAGRAPRRVPVPVARIIAIAEGAAFGIPLTRDQLKQFLRDLQFPTDKAAALLDWQVQVPPDDGMASSEAWLREAGLAWTASAASRAVAFPRVRAHRRPNSSQR